MISGGMAAIAFAGEETGGGGPIDLAPVNGCITQLERDNAHLLIGKYEAVYGEVSRPIPGIPPTPLTFNPMAGRPWGDAFLINYVDLDLSSGIQDWDCLTYTYNGHTGLDTMIRTFDEQIIGVPVFAALSGVVIAVHDGEPDMNTAAEGQPSNFVIIDHGLGRQGWYFHLRQSSILVEVAESVAAGQQIAMCGSSGNSTGPHLHFEIRDGDEVHEPFAGPCRLGESGWISQPTPVRNVYLSDFGLTHQNLASHPGWPHRWPAAGQIALDDPFIRVWFYGANLPASSTWKVRFKRPNGTYIEGAPQSFNNGFWRWFSWWWTYDVAEMHTTLGTWHVEIRINDQVHVEAPIEVRTARTSDFNSPPHPISMAFDPPVPVAGRPVVAVVQSSLTLDDPDFDVVRYEYVWTIDDDVVRTVTTAAQSDVLSKSFLQTNRQLGCTVTPHDGTVAGQPVSIFAQIDQPPIPTLGTAGIAGMAVLLMLAGAVAIWRKNDRPGTSECR